MWILDELKKLKNDERPAVITRSETISFCELWRRSEVIAADLSMLSKRTPVIIYGDKDINIIPTMIAALKAGRAYVPVDITFPPERLRIIAESIDACAIYNYSATDIGDEFHSIPVRAYGKLTNVYSGDIPESMWVDDDDYCYILFTSGSTGNPKGVPISKENLVNYLAITGLEPRYPVDVLLLQPSFSFDASAEIIYQGLSRGISLLCVDKELIGDPDRLVGYMIEHKLDAISSTPSFIDICRKSEDFNASKLPTLKTFCLGGESLEKEDVRFLRHAFPEADIFNTYGPTEATIIVSGCIVTDEMLESELSIPIGDIISEAEYHIVAEDGHDCPVGEVGELVVISKSVSKGYVNAPEKTEACFFRHTDGRMGYRTGDLVFEKNGTLYFAGRKDFQIKLGGYRIELEDISNNLNKVSLVRKNAVIAAIGDDGKVSYIAAFVVLSDDIKETNTLKNVVAIKAELKELVPKYMIPQKIFIVSDFPLNVNGKIDTKALAAEYNIKIR